MDQSIMEYRTLKLKMISARGVKDVTFISKLMVYAVVSMTGDLHNPQTESTNADSVRLRNPRWNRSFTFTFKESLANQDRLTLKIQLVAQCCTDKIIGTVDIPLKVLLDNPDNAGYELSCQVWKKNSKKSRGNLRLSYKFGDRVKAPPPPKRKPGPFHSYEDAYLYCVKIGMALDEASEDAFFYCLWNDVDF